jgi:hypothetical protein
MTYAAKEPPNPLHVESKGWSVVMRNASEGHMFCDKVTGMWHDFQMAWRFTDPKFSMLNADELDRIRPIAASAAGRSWHELFDGAEHLLVRPPSIVSKLDQAWISSDDKASAAALIGKWNPLWLNSKCVFYWSPINAVVTDMTLVLDRFDDFCYPCDDNVVIIFETDSRIIAWCEEFCLLEYLPPEKVTAAWKWATS